VTLKTNARNGPIIAAKALLEKIDIEYVVPHTLTDQPTLKLRVEPTIKQHDARTHLRNGHTGCAWLILCCIRYTD
jgi:hypothetical protein